MVANLQEELKESRRKISDTSEKLGNRIQTLSRENELLKHQLKKYVGAVQKLRDGPMAFETVTCRLIQRLSLWWKCYSLRSEDRIKNSSVEFDSTLEN